MYFQFSGTVVMSELVANSYEYEDEVLMSIGVLRSGGVLMSLEVLYS